MVLLTISIIRTKGDKGGEKGRKVEKRGEQATKGHWRTRNSSALWPGDPRPAEAHDVHLIFQGFLARARTRPDSKLWVNRIGICTPKIVLCLRLPLEVGQNWGALKKGHGHLLSWREG